MTATGAGNGQAGWHWGVLGASVYGAAFTRVRATTWIAGAVNLGSRFFAARIGVNGRRLGFSDVLQTFSAQTRGFDGLTGIGVGLHFGHAHLSLILMDDVIAKARGLLLQGRTHGPIVPMGKGFAVLCLRRSLHQQTKNQSNPALVHLCLATNCKCLKPLLPAK